MLVFPRMNFHGKILSSAEKRSEWWGLDVGVKKQLKVDNEGDAINRGRETHHVVSTMERIFAIHFFFK